MREPREPQAKSKSVPGPRFVIDGPLPCGCRVCREEGSAKLRLWYCPAHAFTFQMLETLQMNLSVLDHLIEHGSSENFDVTVALAAETEAGSVIRKAKDGIPQMEISVRDSNQPVGARPVWAAEDFDARPHD